MGATVHECTGPSAKDGREEGDSCPLKPHKMMLAGGQEALGCLSANAVVRSPKRNREATQKRTGLCSQGSPKKQSQEWTHTCNSFRDGAPGSGGLESPESIEQAGRLEVQVRVDFAALSPNSAGQQVGNSDRVPMLEY